MRKTKVYVAGPYTIGNTADNINLMVQVCDALLTEGYVPFCPLLNHFWHLILSKTSRYSRISKCYAKICRKNYDETHPYTHI